MDILDALRLVYIVDAEAAVDGDRLDLVLGAGTTALWLRVPGASGSELYGMARDLGPRCQAHGAALIVGDRVDVALAVKADGVQLGHRSPPARAIRPVYDGWIGVSCHGRSELESAVTAKADYAVLSPIFGVPRKGPPLGTARFAALAATVTDLPVVGLGGIDADNVLEVRAAGATGVAVIRALREAVDPVATARALKP